MWRIYYDDGTTFGPDDGPWNSAPSEGILAVVEKQGDKLTIHSGGDHYYLCEDGTVVATDDAATILRSLGWLKFGRYTSNAKMAKTFARIRAEWKLNDGN